MAIDKKPMRPLSLGRTVHNSRPDIDLHPVSGRGPSRVMAPDRVGTRQSDQLDATRERVQPALPDAVVRHLIRTLAKGPKTIPELAASENATPEQVYQAIRRARMAGLTISAVKTQPTTFRFDP
jgi:hypothetical protein